MQGIKAILRTHQSARQNSAGLDAIRWFIRVVLGDLLEFGHEARGQYHSPFQSKNTRSAVERCKAACNGITCHVKSWMRFARASHPYEIDSGVHGMNRHNNVLSKYIDGR